jgi:hypothetical protein
MNGAADVRLLRPDRGPSRPAKSQGEAEISHCQSSYTVRFRTLQSFAEQPFEARWKG